MMVNQLIDKCQFRCCDCEYCDDAGGYDNHSELSKSAVIEPFDSAGVFDTEVLGQVDITDINIHDFERHYDREHNG